MFDVDNPVVRLCAHGMELEGEGKREQAAEIFMQAWQGAADDYEKFIAAHYVARHQQSVQEKLEWDLLALQKAQGAGLEGLKQYYPSLYLNVAKGFEDIGQISKALTNYQHALNFCQHLPDDGYGRMISAGIAEGIKRCTR